MWCRHPEPLGCICVWIFCDTITLWVDPFGGKLWKPRVVGRSVSSCIRLSFPLPFSDRFRFSYVCVNYIFDKSDKVNMRPACWGWFCFYFKTSVWYLSIAAIQQQRQIKSIIIYLVSPFLLYRCFSYSQTLSLRLFFCFSFLCFFPSP